MNTKQFLLLSSLLTSCNQFKDISDQQYQVAQRIYGHNVPRTELENIYDSTVPIELKLSKAINRGTGVVFPNSKKNQFYIITAAHLFESLSNYNQVAWKLTAAGMEAEIVKYELNEKKGEDLLMLKVNGCLPFFKGGIAKKVRKRDYLFSVGFPGLMPKEVFFGNFLGNVDKYALNLMLPKMEEGVSGAGIFKRGKHFQYVSMVTARPRFKGISPRATKNIIAGQKLKTIRKFFLETPLEYLVK